MSAPASYCNETDLLTGNIPLPSYISPSKYVMDAAEEIDSKIGFIYVTPINVSDSSSVVRPARLMLKRLNAWLASGRLILALDSGGEDTQLHAYGASLVQEAEETLKLIHKGEISLPGAELVDTGDDSTNVAVPLIANVDEESNVDAFYKRLVGPGGYKNFQYGYPPSYPFTGDYSLGDLDSGRLVK